MKRTRTLRIWGGFWLLLLLLFVFILWNIFAGSVSLSASDIWRILLGGGVFCLFCDLIARTAFAPTEVSISSVTAVFGAPIVIYMMIHRKAA